MTNLQNDLAGSYDEIADILQRLRGNLAEALILYEKAHSIRKALAHDNPSFTGFQRDLAHNSNAVAQLLSASGQMAKALGLHQQSLSTLEPLARANPDDVSVQAELAVTLNQIGDLLWRAGNPPKRGFKPASTGNSGTARPCRTRFLAAPDRTGTVR